MKSTKSMESLKHKTITPRQIKNLVNKALKDTFRCEPAAGLVYLETLESNDLFEVPTGTQGVYLESNDTSSKVIIIKADQIQEDDRQFYLGCRNIGNKTEVKILRRANEGS